MNRVRADLLAVRRGLCESRARAQRLIMAGCLRIGSDCVVRKPGESLPEDCDLRLVQPYPYVSRGGEKLAAALTVHNPSLAGKVGLDLGASTGGFTDLLLQRGVAKVYAVDVGYGQLHQKLREDARVVCLERVNARGLDSRLVPEKIDVLTADLSFISLLKVLPAAAPLLQAGAWIFLLVKPQFEAERKEVGKGGVVRDEAVRRRCVRRVADFAAANFGWRDCGAVASPIAGPKGNLEYMLAMRGMPASG